MNNSHDNNLLILVTLCLDSSLLYILYNTHNEEIDKIFIYTYLIIHLVFYMSLMRYNTVIIDICHGFVFVGIYGSIFLYNPYLVSLCFSLLAFIKVSYSLHGNRCILETAENRSYGYFLDNDYDKIQNLFLFLLFMRILYLFNYTMKDGCIAIPQTPGSEVESDLAIRT